MFRLQQPFIGNAHLVHQFRGLARRALRIIAPCMSCRPGVPSFTSIEMSCDLPVKQGRSHRPPAGSVQDHVVYML